jgi:hypothetical protein
MANFGVYWKNFTKDRNRQDWPCERWFTNSERLLRRLAAGDRLWLVASGESCQIAGSKQGYLVEVLVVHKVVSNRDGDPEYPVQDFAFTIVGEPGRCPAIDPPLLVDELMRPEGQDAGIPIGTLRQAPWKLPDAVVAQLEERLRSEKADVWKVIAG